MISNNRALRGNSEDKQGASCYWRCGPRVGALGRRVRTRPTRASRPLSATAIGQVACSEATALRMTRAAMFNAEVLLDRLDLSPGIVDGKAGENAGKAIVAFQRSRGLAVSGKLDQATWDKLCESASAPVLIAYTVTEDDVRGPCAKYHAILKAWPASVSSATGTRWSFWRKIPHQRRADQAAQSPQDR